ncbi:hypothetical protein PHISCL_03048 [Aspergillus sclerotialis]|uniref:Uncharacterized protein n=1 Tax=Aspergillus sclerotialis TaxID=2070753 RepID=A0A3A2ZZ19_9EURO|nr:hypothetical protein PHISCL_03048 [Aspergillus sclerotialis]
MVIKLGIDQVPRSYFSCTNEGDGLINANYVNEGEPPEKTQRYASKNEWCFGFNDIVLAELTPKLADDPNAPKHVRARWKQDVWMGSDLMNIWAGYETIAYGYGNKDDIFDVSVESEYIDINCGSVREFTKDTLVQIVALPIPGGLAKWDTFWIDLNKGVRALYFPARYVYNKDCPDDAAYAKISFVEQKERSLVYAAPLMLEKALSKLFDWPKVDLANVTRQTATTITLEKKEKIGAYSTDKSLIINIPKFIEQSFLVATNREASPHDTIYIADSQDISAKRRVHSTEWMYPQEQIWVSVNGKPYADYLSRVEQMNLVEETSSELGMGAEIVLSVLCMAASLVPYVGPFLAVAGTAAIEKLKNVQKTSPPEDFTLANVTDKTWNSIPGEAKDKLIKKVKDAIGVLLKAKRK